MSIEWWVGQGVMGVILLAIGLTIWRIMLWAKSDVIVPVVRSHLQLINTLNDHIPRQTTAIDAQTVSLDKQTRMIDQTKQEVEKQTGMLEERNDMFENIIKSQGKIIIKLDERK